MDYTLDQQLAEIDREITMRKRMYPTWVDRGTLRPEAAERQLGALEAARETVRKTRQDQQMTGMNGKRIE